MFKNILTTFSSKFLIAIMNFVLVIVTSKYMGAEIRGEISLVVLAIAIITMLSEVIGGPALIYLIPKTNTKPLLLPSYLWGIASAFIISFVFNQFNLIPEGYGIHILFLGLLAIVKVSNNILLFGKKKILPFNIIHLSYFVVLFSVVLWYIFQTNERTLMIYIKGLYAASIIAFMLSSIFTFIYIEGNGIFPSKNHFKILIKNGLQNQLANMFHILTNRINFYIIGVTALIGVYSTAISFTEALLLFSGSSAGILMAEVAHEKNKKRSQRLTLGLAKMNFLITFLGWIFLVILPNELFTYLLGKDFESVKSVILLLGPGICFIAYKAQMSHYFSGLGKIYINATASFCSLVINLVFAIFLIPRFGIEGAAISASISYFGALTVLGFYFKKERQIPTSFFIPQQDEINLVKEKISQMFGKKLA